jgi:hypothetical protein
VHISCCIGPVWEAKKQAELIYIVHADNTIQCMQHHQLSWVAIVMMVVMMIPAIVVIVIAGRAVMMMMVMMPPTVMVI